MATYEEWNHAIITYFVGGIAHGTSIFLGIDEEILERIGQQFDPRHDRWCDDFRTAVRAQMIKAEKIVMRYAEGETDRGEPRSVAFLCAMVLAASRMADDEEVSSLNFFHRFREVLDLPRGDGRPEGFHRGDEEPLWLRWARWLLDHGLLPTAGRGSGGPTTYIGYPISQTLLRKADRERLLALFADRGSRSLRDPASLVAQLLDTPFTLSSHVRQLLADGGARRAATIDAIYDLYEAWCDTSNQSGNRNAVTRAHQIVAGLYRDTDVLYGEVTYALYPRQPRGQVIDTLEVEGNGTLYTLGTERRGWFQPLIPLSPAHIDDGVSYSVVAPATIDTLVFPRRDFWVLIPDPDDPETGIYATWGGVSLGQPFIILCRETLLAQLRQLRQDLRIEWDGEPYSIGEGWAELRDCMVISEAWSSIDNLDRDLLAALRPTVSLSIAVTGGLRAPNARGWLVGYGPTLTAFGFHDTASVTVTDLATETVTNHVTRANEPCVLPWRAPGDYRIDASSANQQAEPRLVRVFSWEQLQAKPPSSTPPQFGGWHRDGTMIMPSE